MPPRAASQNKLAHWPSSCTGLARLPSARRTGEDHHEGLAAPLRPIALREIAVRGNLVDYELTVLTVDERSYDFAIPKLAVTVGPSARQVYD